MKIDIPGVNSLICNNWACKYNNPNTRTCSYDARVVLNENGRCEILPQGNQPKRKRYKIKGYKKNLNNIYTVKIQWNEEEIKEAIKKIMRGNRSNLQIFDEAADFRRPKHIEDNIYYMSGGTK